MSAVVCAGEVMVELARDPGRDSYRLDYAGDSYNTAVYLARAGCEVHYLTRLGDDEHSGAILNRLRAEGIGVEWVALEAGARPGLYLIDNDAQGERSFSYWRDNSPARALFEQVPDLPVPAVFYFTGITLAITRSGIEGLVSLLQALAERSCQIVYDPNYRPRLWRDVEQAREHSRRVLALCDTVLPTLEDDRALWGLQTAQEVRDFYREFGCREIVVKGDELQVDVWLGDKHCQSRAEPVAAVDTTGAGDSFSGGYLAARLQGAEPSEAIARAQALAAKVVQYRGAVLPREC